jgi:hypothetical protein
VTRLDLNYSGGAQQPDLKQLQPVKDNNDPLHILLGNPGLHPAFNHVLNIKYNRLKSSVLNITLDANITSGDISTRTITDTLGRQVSQPMNVNGKRDMELFISEAKSIWGLDAGVLGRIHYNSNTTFVNSDLSRNQSYSGGAGINFAKYVADKYSADVSNYISYFDSRSSINSTTPIHYWTQTYAGNLTIFLLRNFEINTNLNYNWQQKSSAFARNISVTLWNASIGRNLMSNRLVMKVQANNILNQNSGVSRSNIGNTNTQTSTNILGRYWMFLVTWRFDHKYRHK